MSSGAALAAAALFCLAGCGDSSKNGEQQTCSSASQCDRPSPCEVAEGAQCVEGVCQYQAKSCSTPPASECVNNDGTYRAYAMPGTCRADGSCHYAATDIACAACAARCLVVCQGVTCDDLQGGCRIAGRCVPTSSEPPVSQCLYDSAPDNGSCDDQHPCTSGDRCAAGLCQGTAVPEGQSCSGQVGVCRSNQCGCQSAPECDDRDPCTQDDCPVGQCQNARIPDYVREGDACINQKQVPCADPQVANGQAISVNVTITYTDASGWSQPAACDFTCNADFAKEAGQCIHQKQVSCADPRVANGRAIPASVTITYTDAGGWSQPAACDFTCNTDYCKQTSPSRQCVYAYTEEAFESSEVSTNWFGGDQAASARNVGHGLRIQLSSQMSIGKFAFKFSQYFVDQDVSTLPRPAVAATLRLDLRDDNGDILKTSTVVVPATFSGGWVWWPIEHTLLANTAYKFTAFVTDGYSTGINGPILEARNDPYAAGCPRSLEVKQDDLSEASLWQNWSSCPIGSNGPDLLFKIRSVPACPQP